MSRRKLLWLIPFLTAALWLSEESVQAQLFSGTSRSRMMGRAASGANYFGIMGHIKHPQAYELPTSAPSLVDFVRFAGGALETTSGEIRIMRGKRFIQTLLTAKSTIKLMPGDVVIVEGGRSGRGTIFRGGNNGPLKGNGADGRMAQIGLVGILPYPVIMQMTPEVATKRWILRQLGQDESIATAVKVFERRRFGGAPTLDTRLNDNSVLVFPEGLIDPARLPRLPGPFRAGIDRHPEQQTPAQAKPARPQAGAAAETPLPFTRPAPATNTDPATPPGYSDMLDARESAETSNVGDPEVARDLLTHPGSVTLEEDQPAVPGRARVSDSGSAGAGPSSGNRAAPVRPAPSTAATPRTANDADVTFNPQAVTDAPSSAAPEAEKPYVSQPEPGFTPVRPERTEPETSALPLRPVVPDGTETGPAVSESTDGAALTAPTVESTSPVLPTPTVDLLEPPEPTSAEGATVERPASPGGSLAQQGAAGLAGRSPDSGPSGPGSNESRAAGSPAAGVTTQTTAAGLLSPGEDIVGKSRIVPHGQAGTNWPLIAAGVIGSLGFLAAFSLLLSMTGPGPATPAPAVKSDRYWLDKIINDELPVEEEPAAAPVVSELFGRPTDAPILRLDAAQSEVPRPHFMDRGRQSGVGQRRSPQPDIPEPDSKKPDGGHDAPVVPPRPTSPHRTPDVPLAPAAELQPAAAVAEKPAERPATATEKQAEAEAPATQRKRRIVRVDSGHGPGVPTKKPAPKIAVQPARSVVEGSDLLDRILASVESREDSSTKKGQS